MITPTSPRQNKVSPYPAFTDNNGRRYRISLGCDTFIGSRACAITLVDPQIQPRHARVFVDNGAIWIEPFTGCKVLLNGKSLTGAQGLQASDVVTIGAVRLAYFPGSAPLPAPSKPASPGQPANAVQVLPAPPAAKPIVPAKPAPKPIQSKAPNADLEGDVRYIEGPYMEDPDPNLGRQLAKTAGFLLALWKPAFMMLGNRQKQVPVRYIRVEVSGGQLRVVKMKGEIVTGMISTGDEVFFWGEWQNGTLLMFKGYNVTAMTDIFLRQ